MRTATFVLGLVGGIFGILFGIVALAAGGIGNALDEGSGNQIVGLGVSAMAAATVAIICASIYFAGRRPGLMAAGLAIAGVWHVISISYFGIVGGLLILLAALFAFLGRKGFVQRPSSPASPPARPAQFCSACGEGMEAGALFCRACGSSLTMPAGGAG
jgi:hypothetical protein